jgi:hypothetical protein
MVGAWRQHVDNCRNLSDAPLPGLLWKTAYLAIPCAEFLTSVKQRSHIGVEEGLGSAFPC